VSLRLSLELLRFSLADSSAFFGASAGFSSTFSFGVSVDFTSAFSTGFGYSTYFGDSSLFLASSEAIT
jgi:hypothetical protein